MKKIISIVLLFLLILPISSCEKRTSDQMSGGWKIQNRKLSDEEMKMFYDATPHFDVKYVPEKIIATQVVAGTNYKILASFEDIEKVFVIYKDLEDNVKLLRIEDYNQ